MNQVEKEKDLYFYSTDRLSEVNKSYTDLSLLLGVIVDYADLLQVARLMRMRPLDTDTVGARGLEKQNGGGSRNKRLVSPAARQF